LVEAKQQTSLVKDGVADLRKDLTSVEKSSSELKNNLAQHEKCLNDLKKDLTSMFEKGLTDLRGDIKKQS
jgi:predicted  nucleic acid-binding Zn-ribbon protein